MATQTVDQLIDNAADLLEAKDYLGARILYNQALGLDPFDAKLWNYRSNVHMKLEYPELAFTDAARGLQLLDDKLAKTNLSVEDRNISVFLKIDVLYSCVLAAESLHTFQIALHYIGRLLTNSHLLNTEARQILLEKQALFKDVMNGNRNRFGSLNNSLKIKFDQISHLGTMCVTKYPWDDFEPFVSESETETQLKELNVMLEPFAPKLMVVRMPNNPALFNSNIASVKSSSETGRPQLGIVARTKIKPKERILDEPGVFINNGLYGPKCNNCNNILSASSNKPTDVERATCRKCGERFCSVQCRESSMETYHKAVCGRDISQILAYTAQGISCSSLSHLLVLRLLAIAVQSKQHPLEMSIVKYLTKGVKEETPWDIYYSLSLYLEMLQILGLCPYRDIDKFDFWVYYTIRNKLICNVFGEYKAPMKPANGKLFSFSSFFNHSCVPNAVCITDKHARQVVVACKEGIEQHQQVFISYIDPSRSVMERQSLFQTSYGFTCKCERCVREMGTDNEAEIRNKTFPPVNN